MADQSVGTSLASTVIRFCPFGRKCEGRATFEDFANGMESGITVVWDGLEWLCRDARLGRLHPANTALSREFGAKTALGINPDEPPRCG